MRWSASTLNYVSPLLNEGSTILGGQSIHHITEAEHSCIYLYIFKSIKKQTDYN